MEAVTPTTPALSTLTAPATDYVFKEEIACRVCHEILKKSSDVLIHTTNRNAPHPIPAHKLCWRDWCNTKIDVANPTEFQCFQCLIPIPLQEVQKHSTVWSAQQKAEIIDFIQGHDDDDGSPERGQGPRCTIL